MEEVKKTFEDLDFIHVIQSLVINHIPPYLLEQIKGRSWDVDRFLKLAPVLLFNNSTYIWVLTTDKNIIKGVLWSVIDVLSEKLNVIAFSIDEEYEDGSLEKARDFLREFINDFNEKQTGIQLKEKINWVTSEPELLEAIGGQQPKTILIEV